MTAAGIDVENVSPALRPKYTFAAVNTNVMTIPIMRPRTVSSLRMFARMRADRRERRIVWNRRTGQDGVRSISHRRSAPTFSILQPETVCRLRRYVVWRALRQELRRAV